MYDFFGVTFEELYFSFKISEFETTGGNRHCTDIGVVIFVTIKI